MLTTLTRTLFVEENGQDLIEYALLAGLVSLVTVQIVVSVGSGVNGVWTGVDSQMSSVPTP